MERYEKLKVAALDTKYLHTNSTSHESIFGALAEIVDNSRDAQANNLKIYTTKIDNESSDFSLHFLDDGDGMSPEEALKVITFGSSTKSYNDENIGQYGNGLKSGAMHIGKDLIVFTKKNSIGTIIFVSRTFLDNKNFSSIKTPIPSFNLITRKPYFQDDSSTEELKQLNEARHQIEVETILEYSLFKTESMLYDEFNRIEGDHGTLVIIYNLLLNSDGVCEIDIETDPTDLQMRSTRVQYDRNSQLAHKSLREYLSIIYLNPKMKIFIQDKRVRTRRLDRSLYKPVMYEYSSKKFKSTAEKQRDEAQALVNRSREALKLAESYKAEQYRKYTAKKISHIDYVKATRKVEEAQIDFDLKSKNLVNKQRMINQSKTLNFIFGVNLENKYADGLFIYNCHRLVLMFKRPPIQVKDKDLEGIVGIVDIPYMVLQPSQNKQKFQDTNEINHIINKMGEHMHAYSINLGVTLDQDFWSEFGYVPSFVGPPSSDKSYRRQRFLKVKPVVQCTKCLKWRSIGCFQSKYLNSEFPPENWTCSENADTNFNECSIPESLNPIDIQRYIAPKVTNFNQIEYDEREKESQSRKVSFNEQSFTSYKGKPMIIYEESSIGAKKRKDNESNVSSNNPTNGASTSSTIQMEYNEMDTTGFDDDPKDKNYRPGMSSSNGKPAKKYRRIQTDSDSSSNEAFPTKKKTISKTNSNKQTDNSEINSINVKLENILQDSPSASNNIASASSSSAHINNELVEDIRNKNSRLKELIKKMIVGISNDCNLDYTDNQINEMTDEELLNFKFDKFLAKYIKKKKESEKSAYIKGCVQTCSDIKAALPTILDCDEVEQISNLLIQQLAAMRESHSI